MAGPLPPCRRAGLTDALITGDTLRPAAQVPSAWFQFTDAAGPACPASESAAFATQVGNARPATGAPGVKSAPTNVEQLSPLASLFQWLDPRIPDQVKLVSALAETAGLPLVEVRADQEDPGNFAAKLSLGRTAMFQFHLTDWLDFGRGPDARPVLPQVRALDWTRRLCIYGEDDAESLCPELTSLGVEVKKNPRRSPFRRRLHRYHQANSRGSDRPACISRQPGRAVT